MPMGQPDGVSTVGCLCSPAIGRLPSWWTMQCNLRISRRTREIWEGPARPPRPLGAGGIHVSRAAPPAGHEKARTRALGRSPGIGTKAVGARAPGDQPRRGLGLRTTVRGGGIEAGDGELLAAGASARRKPATAKRPQAVSPGMRKRRREKCQRIDGISVTRPTLREAIGAGIPPYVAGPAHVAGRGRL